MYSKFNKKQKYGFLLFSLKKNRACQEEIKYTGEYCPIVNEQKHSELQGHWDKHSVFSILIRDSERIGQVFST